MSTFEQAAPLALPCFREVIGNPEITGFETGNNRIKVFNNAVLVSANENAEGSGYRKAEIQSEKTGLSIIQNQERFVCFKGQSNGA
jgi:hypothetical protein